MSFITWLVNKNRSTPPPFEPFHVFTDFRFSDLVSEGYRQVPVDVIMLGKTVDDLTISYQFEEAKGKSFWRVATIELHTDKVDTLNVYATIEKYNADIIFQANTCEARSRLSIPLSSPFFVRHRYNHQIFECHLIESDNGYEIQTIHRTGLMDKSSVEYVDALDIHNRPRFGSDTIEYEDGTIQIQNFWNWTMEGKEVWLAPGGRLQLIRSYRNGDLQATERYFENGQLASSVLSYKKTGVSKWWYPKGQLKEEIGYVDGGRNWHITYFENGTIESQGKYISGYYDRGIKHGEWFFYDSLGAISRREVYQNDTLVRITNE